MKEQEYKLKRDKFSRFRGGMSEFLDIYCANCNEKLLLYQKDGRGRLLRMYLDRIFEPASVLWGQLKCPKCDALIATPMVYVPEQRRALRIIKGSLYRTKHDKN